MHEMAMTRSILETALDYAQRAGAARVVKVGLRIGVLCDVVDDYLRMYFEHLSQGTAAEGASIVVARVPVMVECSACEHEFKIEPEEMSCYACPRCGCETGSLIAGTETFIDSIEVEG